MLAGGDGDAAEQLVEFLVIADDQLNVARNDKGLLVVTRGVIVKAQEPLHWPPLGRQHVVKLM
jgi:hypothetical protein